MALAGVATIALCLLPTDRLPEGRDHDPRHSYRLFHISPMVRPVPRLVGRLEAARLRGVPSPTPLQPTPTPTVESQEPQQPPTSTGRITHYYCVGDTTGAYCGNTASGARVFAGAAACDPARLGQTVSVGAEIYLCSDTGGAVRGDHIDIWCYSSARWGWPPDERPCPEYGDGVAVIWQEGERE